MDSLIKKGGSETSDIGAVKGRVLHEVWDFFKIFVIALAIVLPIRYFVAQPFIVNGASMEPTFEDRHYLIIDELSYYFREPKRGEVMVFRYPGDESKYFIKRVIGLPGETVSFRDGHVFITAANKSDAVELKENYLPYGLVTSGPEAPVTLRDGEYFVMGDNRPESFDSRRWGVVPGLEVTGRVLFRVWPLPLAGFIPLPNYSFN